MPADGTTNPPTDLVQMFTDGACSGNPGPGGWAFILSHPASGRTLDGSGAEPATTNNRMELTAVIQGLQALKVSSDVEVVTDSQYVSKGLAEWMPKWKAQGWRRKEAGKFKPVMNVDLWQQLDVLVARHRVRLTHVYGHKGHPENEACDRMAVAAYRALMADIRG